MFSYSMYELVSFIKRGRIRFEILQRLDKPKTPTMLAKELNTHQSTISRALLALEQKGLVECLTPNEKLFRLYRVSNKGKDTLTTISKLF